MKKGIRSIQTYHPCVRLLRTHSYFTRYSICTKPSRFLVRFWMGFRETFVYKTLHGLSTSWKFFLVKDLDKAICLICTKLHKPFVRFPSSHTSVLLYLCNLLYNCCDDGNNSSVTFWRHIGFDFIWKIRFRISSRFIWQWL